MPSSPAAGFKTTLTAAPTGRSSTTLIALGCNTTYTPRQSGRVLVLMTAVAATGTTATGFGYNLYYGTGTAPANNDAVSGTAICSLQSVASLVTTELSTSVALHGTVTGLVADSINSLGATVAGTTYWFDVMFQYITGAATITFTNVNLSVIEF